MLKSRMLRKKLGQRRRGKTLKEEWKKEEEDLLAHSSITLSSLD